MSIFLTKNFFWDKPKNPANWANWDLDSQKKIGLGELTLTKIINKISILNWNFVFSQPYLPK